MGWRPLAALTLGALVTAAAAACPSGGGAAAPAAADRSYAVALEARLEVTQEEPRLLVRINPVPCGCPPLEVLLDGTWYRAVVQADPDAVELRSALASGDRTRTWEVAGSLSSDLRRCGRGAVYLTIEASGLAIEGGGDDE